METKISVEVNVLFEKNKKYNFIFSFYETDGPLYRKIEDEFYIKNSLLGKVFEGRHFEMQILKPDVSKLVNSNKIHFHFSQKDGGTYICWTNQVKSLEEALKLAKFWSAGTTLTIEKDIDLLIIFQKELADINRTLETLEKEYDVVAEAVILKK